MVVTQDKISPIDTTVVFDVRPSGERVLHNQHDIVAATLSGNGTGLLQLRTYEINGEEKIAYEGNILKPLDFTFDPLTSGYYCITFNNNKSPVLSSNTVNYSGALLYDNYTPISGIFTSVTGSFPAKPTPALHPNDKFIDVIGSQEFNSDRWTNSGFQSNYIQLTPIYTKLYFADEVTLNSEDGDFVPGMSMLSNYSTNSILTRKLELSSFSGGNGFQSEYAKILTSSTNIYSSLTELSNIIDGQTIPNMRSVTNYSSDYLLTQKFDLSSWTGTAFQSDYVRIITTYSTIFDLDTGIMNALPGLSVESNYSPYGTIYVCSGKVTSNHAETRLNTCTSGIGQSFDTVLCLYSTSGVYGTLISSNVDGDYLLGFNPEISAYDNGGCAPACTNISGAYFNLEDFLPYYNGVMQGSAYYEWDNAPTIFVRTSDQTDSFVSLNITGTSGSLSCSGGEITFHTHRDSNHNYSFILNQTTIPITFAPSVYNNAVKLTFDVHNGLYSLTVDNITTTGSIPTIDQVQIINLLIENNSSVTSYKVSKITNFSVKQTSRSAVPHYGNNGINYLRHDVITNGILFYTSDTTDNVGGGKLTNNFVVSGAGSKSISLDYEAVAETSLDNVFVVSGPYTRIEQYSHQYFGLDYSFYNNGVNYNFGIGIASLSGNKYNYSYGAYDIWDNTNGYFSIKSIKPKVYPLVVESDLPTILLGDVDWRIHYDGLNSWSIYQNNNFVSSVYLSSTGNIDLGYVSFSYQVNNNIIPIIGYETGFHSKIIFLDRTETAGKLNISWEDNDTVFYNRYVPGTEIDFGIQSIFGSVTVVGTSTPPDGVYINSDNLFVAGDSTYSGLVIKDTSISTLNTCTNGINQQYDTVNCLYHTSGVLAGLNSYTTKGFNVLFSPDITAYSGGTCLSACSGLSEYEYSLKDLIVTKNSINFGSAYVGSGSPNFLELRTTNQSDSFVKIFVNKIFSCDAGEIRFNIEPNPHHMIDLLVGSETILLSGLSVPSQIYFYFNTKAGSYQLNVDSSTITGVMPMNIPVEAIGFEVSNTGISPSLNVTKIYDLEVTKVINSTSVIPTNNSGINYLRYNSSLDGIIFYTLDTSERRGGGKLVNDFIVIGEGPKSISLDYEAIDEISFTNPHVVAGSFTHIEQYSHQYFGMDLSFYNNNINYIYGMGITSISGNKYNYSYGSYGLINNTLGYMNIKAIKPKIYPALDATNLSLPSLLIGETNWDLSYNGAGVWGLHRDSQLVQTITGLAASGSITNDFINIDYTVNSSVIPEIGINALFSSQIKFENRSSSSGTINISWEDGSTTFYNRYSPNLDIDLGLQVQSGNLFIVGTSTPPSGVNILAHKLLVCEDTTISGRILHDTIITTLNTCTQGINQQYDTVDCLYETSGMLGVLNEINAEGYEITIIPSVEASSGGSCISACQLLDNYGFKARDVVITRTGADYGSAYVDDTGSRHIEFRTSSQSDSFVQLFIDRTFNCEEGKITFDVDPSDCHQLSIILQDTPITITGLVVSSYVDFYFNTKAGSYSLGVDSDRRTGVIPRDVHIESIGFEVLNSGLPSQYNYTKIYNLEVSKIVTSANLVMFDYGVLNGLPSLTSGNSTISNIIEKPYRLIIDEDYLAYSGIGGISLTGQMNRNMSSWGLSGSTTFMTPSYNQGLVMQFTNSGTTSYTIAHSIPETTSGMFVIDLDLFEGNNNHYHLVTYYLNGNPVVQALEGTCRIEFDCHKNRYTVFGENLQGSESTKSGTLDGTGPIFQFGIKIDNIFVQGANYLSSSCLRSFRLYGTEINRYATSIDVLNYGNSWFRHNVISSGLLFYTEDSSYKRGGGKLINKAAISGGPIEVDLDYNALLEFSNDSSHVVSGTFPTIEQCSHQYFGLDFTCHDNNYSYSYGTGITSLSGNRYNYAYGSYGVVDNTFGYLKINSIKPKIYPAIFYSEPILHGESEWKLSYVGNNAWNLYLNDDFFVAYSGLETNGIINTEFFTLSYTKNTSTILNVGFNVIFHSFVKMVDRVVSSGTLNISRDNNSTIFYNKFVDDLEVDLGLTNITGTVSIVGTSTPPSGVNIVADNFIVNSGYYFAPVFSGTVQQVDTAITGTVHTSGTVFSGYTYGSTLTPRKTFQLIESDSMGLAKRQVFSNIDLSGDDYFTETTDFYNRQYAYTGTKKQTTTVTGYYVVSGIKTINDYGYIVAGDYLPIDVMNYQQTSSGDSFSGTLTGVGSLIQTTTSSLYNTSGIPTDTTNYLNKVGLAVGSGIVFIGVKGTGISGYVYETILPPSVSYTGYVNLTSSPYTLTGYNIDFNPSDIHTFSYNDRRGGFLSFREYVSNLGSDEIRTLTTGVVSNSLKRLFIEGASQSDHLFYHCPDYNTILFVDSAKNLKQYNVSEDVSAFSVVNVDDYNLRAGTADVAHVTAEVINTWGDPLSGKNVLFERTDGDGEIVPPSAVTNGEGVASTTYRAGTIAGPVKIVITIAD